MSNTIWIHACIEFKERNTSTCICNQQIHVWTCCVKGKLIIDVKFDCNLCRCSSFEIIIKILNNYHLHSTGT